VPAKRAVAESRLRQLGRRIALLRRASGLSQETLAWQAGIHTNHLSMIERGRANPSVVVLFDISKALHVEVGSLFEDAKE
jgi:transcriptional regulator with XRE-family HTH domain